MKQYLFIASSAPFNSSALKEALDMTLIYAAIDQQANLLLKGSALYALLDNCQIEQMNVKNYLKTFGTLSLYDIDQIYICSESMEQLKLDETQFYFDVEVVDNQQQSKMFEQCDQVVTL